MRARLTLASLLTALLILVAFVVHGQMTAVAAPAPAAPAAAHQPINVFLDTDTGVDDAVALALLLRARPTVNLVGISTVAGNTTVENATKNVLTVLDVAHRSVPVTIGAAAPLEFPA